MNTRRVSPVAAARAAGALAWLLFTVAGVAAVEPPTSDAKPIRRYGLFIGANDGGPERARLLFAESDSRAMVRVLQEAGGISPQDCVVLVNPDAEDVARRLAELGARIRRERPEARRVEFVLYYSGHSDEEALMMGTSRMGYAELRDAVRDLGADISIAILDSCASGAFIRMKGGQRKTPFLVDESSAVQGQVYLTSSSADEASQESDALGGSFFTHALVSALRGAADFSLDGKVTLHEAYQYASQDTLERTEKTQAGPQHPSWYINLNGTGDLVLTDLRSTSAGLTMSEEITGKVYIRDERGKLVAEVRKSAGTPLTLALPAGSYTVGTYTDERSQEAKVTLRDGKWATLSGGNFRDSPRIATRSRGDADEAASSVQGWTQTDEQRARELVQGEDGDDLGAMIGELGRQIGERIRAKVAQALERELGASPPEDGKSAEDWKRADGSFRESGQQVPLVPLSISLVPGLSFPSSGDARKIVSVNALIGISWGIAGVEASGIMNVTSHDVTGVQAAGIGNTAGGSLVGVQSAGIFNIVEGRAAGVQSAGVFNVARKGGGILQASGVFNMVESSASGAQLTGVFNFAPGIQGIQVAGVANVADGPIRGMQVGGVFNYAGTMRGVQIAVANAGAEVEGLQVGVVNVAGAARGLQIGLVNVSRSLAGLPLGLVNIVGDGLMLFSVAWDDRGYASVELASGKGLYSLLSAGALFGPDGIPTAVSALAGLGAHLALGPFFVEADVGARNAFGVPPAGGFVPFDAIPFPSARLKVGGLLFNRIGGFAGYSVDCLVGLPGMPTNTLAHTGAHSVVSVAGVDIRLFPRFVAGLSIGRQPRGR